MGPLSGKVTVVTGASRGQGIAVQVDHSRDEQIAALFERVQREQGRLDVLVNNVIAIPGGRFRHYAPRAGLPSGNRFNRGKDSDRAKIRWPGGRNYRVGAWVGA
jgi:NAD(P)-dependent dehydrogenase (short-subunit alcohol dehydrogenase family)